MKAIVTFPKNVKFYQDPTGDWRWRIEANNGQKIASASEGYRKKTDAIYNLCSVGKTITESELFNQVMQEAKPEKPEQRQYNV